MTSIASYLSSLSNQTTNDKKTSANSLADSLTTASTAQVNAVPGTADVSYLLNLSDEAKHYLATQANKTDTGTDTDAESFILTAQQQKQLNDIIAKYKDKPFTQETFDAMIEELDKAGLGPQEMAAKDQVKMLNPTQLFLDAINGTDNGLTFDSATGETQKAKADAYLQSIYDQWESISTTAESNT